MGEAHSKISTAGICEMLVVLLNEESVDITPQAKLSELSGWDSMGILLLMAELDEKFGITLQEQHIKSLQTIADIVAIIRDRGFVQE